jgi:hypothetical protein
MRTKTVMRTGDLAVVIGVAFLAFPGRPLAAALVGAVILGAGVGLPYAPVFNTAAAWGFVGLVGLCALIGTLVMRGEEELTTGDE